MEAVIIEDEKEILNGMKEVLEELHSLPLHIHSFDHAEEALLYIREHRPEIVITDIVLPRMSGMELIEHIQSSGCQPKVIIVSGYNNFEYAQKGIKLGVHDYILKPFDNVQFRQVVLGIIEMIGKEREEQMRRSPEASALGAKALRDKFLHGLCMQPTALQEHVYYRLKFWSLDWLAEADYYVLAIDFAKPQGQRITENEAELKSFAIGNIVEELIAAYQPSVLFRNTLNHWCLITGRPHEIEALADEIAAKVTAFQKYPVHIGISGRTRAVQSLAAAYEQAVRALHMCLLDHRSHKLHFPALTEHTEAKQDWVQRLSACMLTMNMQELESAVEAMLKEFALAGHPTSIGELSRQSLERLVELHSALASRLESSLHHIPLELWDALDRCTEYEELKRCIVDYLKQLAGRTVSRHSHYIIEKAKQLIDTHFAENITMAGTAEVLSVHPVWLSQLFKRECGINFVDYLADVRIEQAKRLLRDSDLKIYEIVRKIGYQDLQHFGQIFKKKTGVSPKEYRFGK
ncbi:response regulator [Paenibacillus thalictri]|uniref:response regulator n=1 Tax=Paenibacillus thalictri TaxID=2527873 RepID=UPI0013EF311F|nr:response regulator [Paenibacillus thalictri]